MNKEESLGRDSTAAGGSAVGTGEGDASGSRAEGSPETPPRADAPTGSVGDGSASLDIRFSGADLDFVGAAAGAEESLVGTVVGGVYIDQRIGEGGMGSVYTGRHLKLNRPVAVKFVRPEIASARALKRFEFEAQVLGTLDHAWIVRVRHADTAMVNGREHPFFVMDIAADAKQLNEYATTRHLSEREWMELFRKICDAVAAAHAKGVVHRDLKPGNILVTPEKEPRVIDFGIAIVRDSALSQLQPAEDGAFGTPRYMSPEQARGDLDAIDVTSDVYSLGVVMYEALSGRMPYDVKAGMTMQQVADVIGTAPPRPLELARSGTSRDVCAIVAKCLAKEKSGRYSSAAELAADIGRFLADEAIVAAPQTAYDAVRRFCRRYRALATAAASILATLVISLVVVSAFYLQSERLRKEAQVALGEARDERAISDKLVSNVVRVLGGSRPHDATETQAQRTRLVAAANDVRERLADSPSSRLAVVQAKFLNAIGDSLMLIGQPVGARDRFREAVELIDNPLVGDAELLGACLGRVAHAALECGDFNEAIAAGERAAGTGDPPGLRSSVAMARMSLNQLDEAAADYAAIEASLAESLPQFHPDRASMLTNHAEILRRQGDLDAAEARLREAVEIWEMQPRHDDSREGTTFHNLGEVLRRTGRLEEAEGCHQKGLALHRALLPPGHFLVSTGLSKLGEVYRETGRLDEAKKLFDEAINIREEAGLGEHPEAALLLERLALVHAAQGRPADERACLARCVAIREKRLGGDHPETLKAQASYAGAQKSSQEIQGP